MDLGRQIIGIFISPSEIHVTELAVSGIRIVSLAFLFNGFNLLRQVFHGSGQCVLIITGWGYERIDISCHRDFYVASSMGCDRHLAYSTYSGNHNDSHRILSLKDGIYYIRENRTLRSDIKLTTMTNHKYRIAFYKFNTEQKKLGVNVFDMDELRPSLNEGPVFREAFITTYFICGGIERLTVNGHTREVSRGDVICTLPGEIWEWTGDTHLEGYCVIFEKGFITDFFVMSAFSTVSNTCVRTPYTIHASE